ncbi:LamG domain-containing protein, partial [Kitasatospora sp. NPDC049258]
MAAAVATGALLGSGAVPWTAPVAVAAGSAASTGDEGARPEAGGAAEVAAVVEARRTGKPVEVASKRSETSDVVAQPDGKLVATTYVQPHRVRRAGGWVDIDPALSVRADGS